MAEMYHCTACGQPAELSETDFAEPVQWNCPHCGVVNLTLPSAARGGVPPSEQEHDPLAALGSASSTTENLTRRRRAAPGFGTMLRQFVSIIGGGFMGLVIGYYLLVLIGGPQANFLEVRLPGMPWLQEVWHTNFDPAAAPRPQDLPPADEESLPPLAAPRPSAPSR